MNVLPLKSNAIHLWEGSLDLSPEDLASFQMILSDDEKTRAARFKFPCDRQRFIVARGLLRQLLGQYLGQSPESIEFAYNEKGKPYLAFSSLEFNLSHAQDQVVYAITQEVPIGVDLEYRGRDVEMEDLAERFFSPAEYKNLMSLSEDLRREGFFCAWTRKEAVIKAMGQGLHFPLQDFTVSLDPREPPALQAILGDEPAAWHLFSIERPDDFALALAVRAQGKVIEGFDLNLIR